MKTKFCPRCKRHKPLSGFSKTRSTRDGLDCYCKQCRNTSRRLIYEGNKEEELERGRQWHEKNPEKVSQMWREWYKKNGLKHRLYSRNYYREHKEERNQYSKKWAKEHPEKVKYSHNKSDRERRATVRGNLNSRMGCLLHAALKRNKNNRTWQSLVGYTTEELKTHIENQFTEAMTWKEYISGRIHIDHIVPISFFEYSKPEDQEFQYCWSLDNLQPLWAEDNLLKNKKVNWTRPGQ